MAHDESRRAATRHQHLQAVKEGSYRIGGVGGGQGHPLEVCFALRGKVGWVVGVVMCFALRGKVGWVVGVEGRRGL